MQNDHEQTWKRESERDVSFHKKSVYGIGYVIFKNYQLIVYDCSEGKI